MQGVAAQSLIKERYFPERRIVAVSVEFERVTDYAIKPLTFLSKHGIKMLSCIMQSHPDRPSVHATLFLDLTESDLTPASLLSELRTIPHVKRIELIDIPLTHGEARLIVFTLEDIHRLFERLRKIGPGGLAIMYHMGFGAGEALAERIARCFKENKRALEYVLLYYESLGQGRFKLKSYIEGVRCRVEARELMECIGVTSNQPNSQLFRGLLAGLLSGLWKSDVEVVEVKCIAMGDPHCEFEARVK